MTNCLVIGAGIVGMTTALKLAENGKNVTILDCKNKGQASNNAGGILFPLSPWNDSKFMQELCISGHDEYNKLFLRLSGDKKKSINFTKSNILIFGKNLISASIWYRNNNFVEIEYNDGRISNKEENIITNHKESITIKDINLVDPRKLSEFLHKELKNKNASFIQMKVEDLNLFLKHPENNKYDFIIVSAGAWSNEVLNDKKVFLKPIKGQTMLFRTNKKIISNTLLFDDLYIIPRGDNKFLIGSTLEDVGFDESISNEAKSIFDHALSKLFSPSIKILEKEYFFGFRPFANQKPYICKSKNNERVIYNFGHYRYGILTAIASAKIVDSMVS